MTEPTRLPLVLADIYRTHSISQIALSPDGKMAAYIESEAFKTHDQYIDNLWMVQTPGEHPPHRLTRQKCHDSHPLWSPNGRYLAFLSDRPVEFGLEPDKGPEAEASDEKTTQLWVLDIGFGGEPHQLTNRPEGVQDFSWSPDSLQLVIESRDPSPKEAAYLKARRNPKEPGAIVIDRVQHKADGSGYLDDVKSHLFIVDRESLTTTPLTEGPANETHPVWSPDGRWILFSSNRTGDADNNRREDLWLIRPDRTAVKRVTRGDVDAHLAQFSSDSRHIAFIASSLPENSYVLDQIMVVSMADTVPVSDLTTCIGVGWREIGGIVPDSPGTDPIAHAHRYPIPIERTPATLLGQDFTGTVSGRLVWEGPHHILALAHHQAQQKLVRFGLPEGHEILAPNDRNGTIDSFDAASANIVMIQNRPDDSRQVYSMSDGAMHCLTRINPWLTNRTLGKYRWIQYPNHDGDTIEGLLLMPPGYQPDQDRAPLLVNIHGGPMWYDTAQFEFDTQYWANRGYLVLMVNYRGSISYGEKFCQSIQSDWGPREHDDVMCGVDYLVERDWVDPDRLYCTGFSQGGIMTNWAIGHTDRFRAAVSEHGMWDYSSAFGTDDCHLWWQDDIGVPWQNPETYYRMSPLNGLASISTPLLITAGEHDWRCPLNQAEELYMALKKRGVPTQLIIYPGEHHGISRPARAIDRLERIDRWLAAYGGQPVDAVDQTGS